MPSFEFRGTEYEVPESNDWSVGTVRAFEQGKMVGLLDSLVPELMSDLGDEAKLSDLKEALEAMSPALGMGKVS